MDTPWSEARGDASGSRHVSELWGGRGGSGSDASSGSWAAYIQATREAKITHMPAAILAEARAGVVDFMGARDTAASILSSTNSGAGGGRTAQLARLNAARHEELKHQQLYDPITHLPRTIGDVIHAREPPRSQARSDFPPFASDADTLRAGGMTSPARHGGKRVFHMPSTAGRLAHAPPAVDVDAAAETYWRHTNFNPVLGTYADARKEAAIRADEERQHAALLTRRLQRLPPLMKASEGFSTSVITCADVDITAGIAPDLVASFRPRSKTMTRARARLVAEKDMSMRAAEFDKRVELSRTRRHLRADSRPPEQEVDIISHAARRAVSTNARSLRAIDRIQREAYF